MFISICLSVKLSVRLSVYLCSPFIFLLTPHPYWINEASDPVRVAGKGESRKRNAALVSRAQTPLVGKGKGWLIKGKQIGKNTNTQGIAGISKLQSRLIFFLVSFLIVMICIRFSIRHLHFSSIAPHILEGCVQSFLTYLNLYSFKRRKEEDNSYLKILKVQLLWQITLRGKGDLGFRSLE